MAAGRWECAVRAKPCTDLCQLINDGVFSEMGQVVKRWDDPMWDKIILTRDVVQLDKVGYQEVGSLAGIL